MKLSTKGRYGARAMLDLALNYGKGPILLKGIARRQEISERYLEHLIATLKLAGLVKSVRGARGGYTLAKPPSQIRLSEIIETLEGSVALVECVDDPKVCHRVTFCVTRDIWGRMSEAMIGVLDSTTLEDLVQKQKEKERPETPMYYI